MPSLEKLCIRRAFGDFKGFGEFNVPFPFVAPLPFVPFVTSERRGEGTSIENFSREMENVRPDVEVGEADGELDMLSLEVSNNGLIVA